MSTEKCLWCQKPFERRASGGKPQRFCSQACRYAFHQAARKWAIKAIDAGLLTVDSLQNASVATCTLLSAAKSVSRAVGEGKGPKDACRAKFRVLDGSGRGRSE